MISIHRQGTRGSGRSALVLLSVLALLALACFPVLAQADSVGPEYNTALPGDGGPTQNENIAKSSKSPKSGGAEAPPTSGGAGEGYAEQAPPSSEGQGNPNADTGGGTSQGSPGKGNNPPAGTKVHPSAPHVQSTPAATSDDGSSPLVPILIAAAVLAAISIAALLIRQRRQRDGSSPSLSTKAG
jgi:hypothetical protein